MNIYLRIFATSLLGILFILGMFTYLLDPYAVFGAPQMPGVNERKTTAADKGRMIKSYQVLQQKPQVLLVGNSRIEIGLPKAHRFYRGTVFNLGLPGAGVMMQYDYAWHAIKSTGSVKQVILAVDFVDFLTLDTQANLTMTGEWQSRLNYKLHTNSLVVTNKNVQLKEKISFLLSQSAIQDTFLMLIQQRMEVNALDVAGFNDGLLYHQVVRVEGFDALYQQKQQELDKRLANPKLKLDPGGREFRGLSMFLQQMIDEKIEVILFINPYHYPYLDSIVKNGLADEFDTWKELMTVIAKQYQIPLYDFSVQSSLVMQLLVSPSRNLNDNQWFWEPAHYRHAFGTLILDVFAQQNCLITMEARNMQICKQLSVGPTQ